MNEPNKLDAAQADAMKALRQLSAAEGIVGEPAAPAVAQPVPHDTPATTEALDFDRNYTVPPLDPTEIQMLREVIFSRMKLKKQEFELPALPVTDEDRDRFADLLIRRKPFTETHTMLGGKMTVTFRTKTKRETDIVFEQLDVDFKAGIIKSEAKYVTLLNGYNLIIQMIEMNGAPMTCILPPPGQAIPSTWSLNKVLREHTIDSLPESTVFILIGALTQFDNKVKLLSQEALSGNFSKPAGAF